MINNMVHFGVVMLFLIFLTFILWNSVQDSEINRHEKDIKALKQQMKDTQKALRPFPPQMGTQYYDDD